MTTSVGRGGRLILAFSRAVAAVAVLSLTSLLLGLSMAYNAYPGDAFQAAPRTQVRLGNAMPGGAAAPVDLPRVPFATKPGADHSGGEPLGALVAVLPHEPDVAPAKHHTATAPESTQAAPARSVSAPGCRSPPTA